MRVGVISDTHGLLRPRVLDLLAGVDRILHAGDVGDPQILERLAHTAPVTAVRGNVDVNGPLARLPDIVSGTLGEIAFRMVHRREDADPDWLRQCRLLIYGHSHRPEILWQGSCLLLNPGSCGTRRFRLPLTLAILHLDGPLLTPEIQPVD